jgi:hypothetical protein
VTVEFIDPPPPDDDVLDGRPWTPSRRRKRVILGVALIAAAATAAGVGTALTSHHRPDRRHSAAVHVTNRPTPHLAPIANHGSCTATGLPAAWKSAVAAGTTSYGKLQLRVVGITTDGTPVVDYTPPELPASTMAISVGTLPNGATKPHLLATFSRRHSGSASYWISMTGNVVVAGISFDKVGARESSAAPREIAIVDASTGARTVLRNALDDNRLTVGSIAMFDGVVYWDDYPGGVAKDEVVHAYDLTGKVDQVVYRGTPGGEPQASAAGVWWGTGTALHPNRAAKLPTPVAQRSASEKARAELTTDGAAWAWSSGKSIEWWTPGSKVIGTAVHDDGVFDVEGPLVFFGSDGKGQLIKVLDTRTGAVAALGAGSFDTGSHGIVYFQNSPRTITPNTRFTITRLDTSTLPPLTC